ncbi:MAG: DegT/DnrJ/EryC1/StrS family aminotransferase [Planctomycetota bacterium]
MTTSENSSEKLAIDGGAPASPTPLPFMGGADLIGAEERKEVLDVIDSQSLFRYYGTDPRWKVKTFEEELSRFIEIPHVLAVSSGTAALRTAFHGCGLECGDEIIMPAFSFLACPASALTCGLKPVFAECTEGLLLDPDKIEQCISEKTRAILVVHMVGASADMDKIIDIANKNSLMIIEDCAQAFGTTYKGASVGSFGKAGIFSLQAMKTISSGEGGVVVTNDPEVHQRALWYHDLGFQRKGRLGSPIVGENLRMAELTGAVALAQLRKSSTFLKTMRSTHMLVRQTAESFGNLKVRSVKDPDGDNGSALILELPDKEQGTRFRKALSAENIRCDRCSDKLGYGYPVIHDALGEFTKCPETEARLERCVMIPLSPALTQQQVECLIHGVQKVGKSLQQ